MTQGSEVRRPTVSERFSAVVAVAALAGAAVIVLLHIVAHFGAVLLALAGLIACVTAGWYLVSRRGLARFVAGITVVIALVALVAGVVVAFFGAGQFALIVVLGLVSVVAARHALRRTPKALRSRQRQLERSGEPAPPAGPGPRARPRRQGEPVLIMNLKSGGGKAERFGLPDECRSRGIEPVVLRPGDDLTALAEAAVGRGAAAIGMAGGDGSQAAVAAVAARLQVPHVCVPAGTRNHFALDLGLDRDDVVGALDAYADRIERRIDLATVNGRTFVNNCSLGVYAKIVRSPEYRDAKLRTAADLLPAYVGPSAEPLDLRYTGPDGTGYRSAHLILVSNNPYQLAHPGGRGTRERLDLGLLGIVAVQVAGAAEARRFTMAELSGQAQRFGGWREWTAPGFEVRSGGPVDAGVDGEAVELQPPLVFATWPSALRVWLPASAIAISPAVRAVRILARSTAADLVGVVAGHGAAR